MSNQRRIDVEISKKTEIATKWPPRAPRGTIFGANRTTNRARFDGDGLGGPKPN